MSQPDYEKLTAAQTRSPLHIDFEGLDVVDGGPDAAIRFVISTDKEALCTIVIPVAASAGGVNELVAQGYDALIDGLRQMLWEAATQRWPLRNTGSTL